MDLILKLEFFIECEKTGSMALNPFGIRRCEKCIILRVQKQMSAFSSLKYSYFYAIPPEIFR